MEFYCYNTRENEFNEDIRMYPYIRVYRNGNKKDFKGIKFTPYISNIQTVFKEFTQLRSKEL